MDSFFSWYTNITFNYNPTITHDENNEIPNLNKETEPITPSHYTLPSIDGNLNLGKETKKQHNK